LEAVIKVGGSLAETPESLKALGRVLLDACKNHRIIIVPGGGRFADVVRDLDAKFSLPAEVSHRIAILAMEQYGLLLAQVFPDACSSYSFKEARMFIREGKLTIFLPSKLLLHEDPFSPSWDVTSDSIAAHIAVKLKAPKAVFVTNVDGIYTKDPKNSTEPKLFEEVSAAELLEMKKRTSVDKFLPQFLIRNYLECYVVNGNYPKRVEAILSNQQTICTKIVLQR
jgi:aspartokinase-like uncharacterized kinase